MTFDQFIIHSKWMFVPNLKKFPQGVPEIKFMRTGQMVNLMFPASTVTGMNVYFYCT